MLHLVDDIIMTWQKASVCPTLQDGAWQRKLKPSKLERGEIKHGRADAALMCSTHQLYLVYLFTWYFFPVGFQYFGVIGCHRPKRTVVLTVFHRRHFADLMLCFVFLSHLNKFNKAIVEKNIWTDWEWNGSSSHLKNESGRKIVWGTLRLQCICDALHSASA